MLNIDHVIVEISKKISNLDQIQNEIEFNDLSAASGISSVCILFAELDYTFPNKDWDKIGHKYLVSIKERIENGITNYSLSCLGGLGGIGFSILALSQNQKRYQKFLSEFNSYYFNLLKKHLNEIKNSQKNDSFLYETIYGLAGIGRYLLFFKDVKDANDLLREILKLIVELTNKLFFGTEDKPKKVYSIACEKSIFDCGLAHGISGPLSLLSICYKHNVCVEGQLESVRKISNWLINTQVSGLNGLYFPNSVFISEENKDISLNTNTRDAWCYGSPGICRTLVLAGEATGDARYRNCAISVFKDVIKRNFELQKNYSPTFCHGISGLLMITILLNKSLNMSELKSYKLFLVEALLEFYNTDNIFGFQNIEQDACKKVVVSNELGVLTGATGVLLALLAFKNQKTYTRWESILLLN
ncbi:MULTISPECIES: lanthionine synthetase C family protein [Bacillus amyloliquefaciens group]|uniref:lanthionine synthetase C family protein n=1 Tax=Bacillus amyloliquefaciens group TaxID=1938374 RepID=UPI000645D010|nr:MULTISPECIES: lanthionine synthetase C family protein [Bacillus amyloliquefaciens group]MDQ8091286.1 lanthionine synthetase C family protein [Bacillus amyloliquefaciens]MDU0812813.1 lanthionine synthetase C family protein [Bacillus siamensis]MED5048485.1 lanthionine synthetase C family protein [Bacillus siamensis]MED5096905.1 lanthionine synthetase C family protein [Bacillus siamensis]